jgi:hypothetical protein
MSAYLTSSMHATKSLFLHVFLTTMHMTKCTAKMQSNNLFLLFKLALASANFLAPPILGVVSNSVSRRDSKVQEVEWPHLPETALRSTPCPPSSHAIPLNEP